MKLKYLSGFFFCFCLLLISAVNPVSAQQRYSAEKPHPDALPGRIVLKIKPQYEQQGITAPQLHKVLTQIGATSISKKFPNAEKPTERNPDWVDITQIYEIEFSAPVSPEKAAAAVEATKIVAYAEPLYHHRTMYETSDPLAAQVSGPQYHLRKIRAHEAWDIEKGDTNVVIGIIDSGIKYDHPDLMGNLKYNYADPINGLDDDGDGYTDNFRGWDLSNHDNDATTPTNLGHGVPVTGVVSAETDNGIGVAGTGFKCKFMPVKVYPSGQGTGVFRGWEGVVYAADMGNKIVNLSWGNVTPASAYEQDIVNYVTLNKDVVVVAAAGNTHGDLQFHPASYDNVLSVAGTDSMKVLSQTMSYHKKVDICAPEAGIMTTVRNPNLYQNNVGGSSFSAPQVSGAAGLVRSKWPNLTAQQVAEQIRITADQNIYLITGNQPFQEMIGRGFLDMYAALTDTLSPSVRNISKNIDDQRAIYSGDTVIINGDFKNFLRPINAVTVTLTTTSPFVTITDSISELGPLATLAVINNSSDPFAFIVSGNAPANEVVSFRLGYSGQNYSDYQYFDVVVNPDYITLDANLLDVTLSARGTIGYNGRLTSQGVGVSYNGGSSLLYEAGIIIGSSANRISDVVRSEPMETNQHFYRTDAMHYIPGTMATQQATGLMQDTAAYALRAGVEIRTNGYSTAQAPHDKYVIVEYVIKNITTDTLHDLHTGIFADWDIGMASNNAADWDASRSLGYAYSLTPGLPHAGIALLTAHDPSYYAINNFAAFGAVVVGDSFTLAEKFTAISGGVAATQVGVGFGTDVSHVIGAKIGSLAPNAVDTVAFAILAGDDLTDLQASADAALTNYPPVLTSAPQHLAADLPNVKVFPNPAADEVTVAIENSANSKSRITVINSLGQVVIEQKMASAGVVQLNTSGLAAGIYIVRVENNDAATAKKLVISR